jgi:SAM-dependent methyltransferase
VTAVEPSDVMIAQRPPGAAPVVQASAEKLPFADDAFDAAMTVLSHHHWPDQAGGLREMRRVARRAVIFMWDPAGDLGWIVRDYLTTFEPEGLTAAQVAELVGATHIDPVPIPHDCRDGFFTAYWRRPHAYLDPEVRAGISVFRLLSAHEVDDAMRRLRADLESGEWERRNAELLELDTIDYGYRLVY